MGHVNWRDTLNANIITSRENRKCMGVYIHIYLTEKLQNRTVHISTSKQGNPLFPRLNTIPRSWTWLTWHTWRERRCHSCETLLRTRIHVWVISISWTRGLIATNGDAISIGGERRQKPRSEQSTMIRTCRNVYNVRKKKRKKEKKEQRNIEIDDISKNNRFCNCNSVCKNFN